MGVLNVLIADGDDTFGMNLRQALRSQGLECNIHVTDNMDQAVSYIANEEIDVLVADFYVQGGNGISLIQQLKRVNRDAVIILCSVLSKCGGMADATLSQVDLAMEKPCFAGSLCEELSAFVENGMPTVGREPTMDTIILQMIRNLGIPPHVKGYRYLKEAVKMAILSPYSMEGITKIIYPEIAKKYRTGVANIERAIRYAIGDAWKKHRNERWERYLSIDLHQRKKSPSNSELISALAEYYRLYAASLENAR